MGIVLNGPNKGNRGLKNPNRVLGGLYEFSLKRT